MSGPLEFCAFVSFFLSRSLFFIFSSCCCVIMLHYRCRPVGVDPSTAVVDAQKMQTKKPKKSIVASNVETTTKHRSFISPLTYIYSILLLLKILQFVFLGLRFVVSRRSLQKLQRVLWSVAVSDVQRLFPRHSYRRHSAIDVSARVSFAVLVSLRLSVAERRAALSLSQFVLPFWRWMTHEFLFLPFLRKSVESLYATRIWIR
jgi:hypothetical protein